MATSGYRVEGGFNGEGQPHNNWSDWEVNGRAARSGAASDFWRRPAEMLDRAVALGATCFNLSVEWARLEPSPGELDAAALDGYAGILSECRARGLEPVVTLHHFTHPWWQGEEFWLRPGSPDVFAHHVARVVPALAGLCRHWVTIHEPDVVASAGWITGAHPPGRRLAVSDAWCVLDNLLTAHVLAADVVREAQPDAEIMLRTRASSIYEVDRLLVDLVRLGDTGIDAAEVDRYVDERRAVHDAAFPPRHVAEAALRRFSAAVAPYGTVHEPGRGRAWARLRSVARRRVPRRVVSAAEQARRGHTLHSVGVDWHDPVASHALGLPGCRMSGGGRDWSFRRTPEDVASDPAGLRAWCATEAALRPGLGLWVLDEVAADAPGCSMPDELAEAVAAGVPVRGYLVRFPG